MPAADADSIVSLTACALSEHLHARKLSCREVMQAYLDRIDRLNPRHNAIVSLQPRESLLAQADASSAADRGLLHRPGRGFRASSRNASA